MMATRTGLIPAGLLLALAAGMVSCGGDETTPKSSAPSLEQQLDQKLTSAKSIRDLAAVRTWAVETVSAKPSDETRALSARIPSIDQRIIKTLRSNVSRYANGENVEKCRLLLDWADRFDTGDDTKLRKGLDAATQPLLAALLRADPNDADIRRRLGYTEVKVDLGHFLNAPYLEDEDNDAIERMTKRVERDTEKTSDGRRWAAPGWKHSKELNDLVARLKKLEAADKKRLEDPWERKAMEVARETAEAVTKTLENESYKWVPRTFKPYLILVEKDKSWHETKVAEEKANALKELYRTFYETYRKPLGLNDITEVVPVVLFRKLSTYRQYAQKRSADTGAVGHFEPTTGRLIVNEETGIDTLFHEGTHQLIHFNTKLNTAKASRGPKFFASQSYWFEEGVAEYFGANHRYWDEKTKSWRYEIGLVQDGRLNQWRTDEHKAFKLWDLLALTYLDRGKHKATDNEDLNLFAYSQGWFLVYFLNNFAVDAKGRVLIGAKGKYRDRWIQYFKGELEGKTGRRFFLSCMGLLKPDGTLDEPAYKAFEKEYLDYFEWCCRKLAMVHHFKDRKFVPWNKVKNRKGQLIGLEEDDMLHPPKKGGDASNDDEG